MNKKQFIFKLTELYDDFTEKNTKQRIEAYNLILPETLHENKTYDYVFEKLLATYDNFKYAPTPAYIVKLLPKKYNPYYNYTED